MVCASCGATNVQGTPFCASCGQPLSTRVEAQKKTLAVVAFALGLASIPTVGCLGIGALVAIVLGIVALVRAKREPQTYGGQGFAIGGIASATVALVVAVPLALMMAAIAIPSALRARISANESTAAGDIRTIMRAEATYALENGGYYDTPECLLTPGACIPGHWNSAMLGADVAAMGVKDGYRRRFHAGLPAETTQSVSPSSLVGFAVTAVPDLPGRSGIRAFCGDATGRVCLVPDGMAPEVVDGECPRDCLDL